MSKQIEKKYTVTELAKMANVTRKTIYARAKKFDIDLSSPISYEKLDTIVESKHYNGKQKMYTETLKDKQYTKKETLSEEQDDITEKIILKYEIQKMEIKIQSLQQLNDYLKESNDDKKLQIVKLEKLLENSQYLQLDSKQNSDKRDNNNDVNKTIDFDSRSVDEKPKRKWFWKKFFN